MEVKLTMRPSKDSHSNNEDFFQQNNSGQSDFDDLNGIENRLKALWSEYIEHQDKFGLNEKTKALREQYFSLYQSYRRNKNWKQLVANNQSETAPVKN
jgi:hypothetical protein